MPTECLLGLELTCRNGRRCKRQGSEKRGRLHFFYHSPSSELPVRDVKGEQGAGQKTEPYIEKDAENYYVCCYQNNIRAFLRSTEERYLFLCTTCMNEELAGQYDKRFIVGYIEKGKCIRRTKNRVAVQGPTKLCSFRDAYPLANLRRERNFRHAWSFLPPARSARALRRSSAQPPTRGGARRAELPAWCSRFPARFPGAVTAARKPARSWCNRDHSHFASRAQRGPARRRAPLR